MSLEVYKMMHVISIVVFFSLFAAAAYSGKSTKMNKIITGIALLLIITGGMGLKKHLVEGWPMWLNMKVAVWVIVGGLGHMVIAKFPQHGVKAFWVSVGLLTLASYLVNYVG